MINQENNGLLMLTRENMIARIKKSPLQTLSFLAFNPRFISL